MENTDFFNILFDKDQSTSFSEHFKGTKVFPVSNHLSHSSSNFFTINALHPTQDLKPTADYHSPSIPRRADHNTVCYRNILIEMDKIPLKEQMQLMLKIGVPWSTAVYSGSKSIHFIISLETPIQDESTYRRLVERLYRAMGGSDIVDTANKNPSRFSRFPNAIRSDKGNKTQYLVSVKKRVPNDLLISWIEGKIGIDVPVTIEAKVKQTYIYSPGETGHLSGRTMNTLMSGSVPGERNRALYMAACDFANCNYEIDIAIEKLELAIGADYHETSRICKAAYNRVESDKIV